ncbi:MAG: MarR family transcriptional regulator [Myxococcota bacterium]
MADEASSQGPETDAAVGERADADELFAGEALASDAIGQLIEFWGFKRNMGRLWTVLYLAREPLSARQLQARLGLSSGAVSMTANELQRWGVVKKVWVHGERRDYFVAEGNFWKMISRVLEERERAQILEALDVLEEAKDDLCLRAESDDPAVRARAAHALEGVDQLLELSRLGRELLDVLIRNAQVDATPLLRILLGASRSEGDR